MIWSRGKALRFVIVVVSLFFSLNYADAQRIRPSREIQVAPDSMPDYILLSDSANGFLQFAKIAIQWTYVTDSVCLNIIQDRESLKRCFYLPDTLGGGGSVEDASLCDVVPIGDSLRFYVCIDGEPIDSFTVRVHCNYSLNQLTDSTAQLLDCNGVDRGVIEFNGEKCIQSFYALPDSSNRVVLTWCDGTPKDTVDFFGGGMSGFNDTYTDSASVWKDDTVIIYRYDMYHEITDSFPVVIPRDSIDSYAYRGTFADDTLTIVRQRAGMDLDSFKVEIIIDSDTDIDSMKLTGNVLHLWEDDVHLTTDLSQFLDNTDDQSLTIDSTTAIWDLENDPTGPDLMPLPFKDALNDDYSANYTDPIRHNNNVGINVIPLHPLDVSGSDVFNTVQGRFTNPSSGVASIRLERGGDGVKYDLMNWGSSIDLRRVYPLSGTDYFFRLDTSKTGRIQHYIWHDEDGYFWVTDYGQGYHTPNADGSNDWSYILAPRADGKFLEIPFSDLIDTLGVHGISGSVVGLNGLHNISPDSIYWGGQLLEDTRIRGNEDAPGLNEHSVYFDTLKNFQITASTNLYREKIRDTTLSNSKIYDLMGAGQNSRFFYDYDNNSAGRFLMNNTGLYASWGDTSDVDSKSAIYMNNTGTFINPEDQAGSSAIDSLYILTSMDVNGRARWQSAEQARLLDYDFAQLRGDTFLDDIQSRLPLDSLDIDSLVWRSGTVRIGNEAYAQSIYRDPTTGVYWNFVLDQDSATTGLQIYGKRSALDIYHPTRPYKHFRNDFGEFWERVYDPTGEGPLEPQRWEFGATGKYETSSEVFDTTNRPIFTIRNDADEFSLNIVDNYIQSDIYASDRPSDTVAVNGLFGADSSGHFILLPFDSLGDINVINPPDSDWLVPVTNAIPGISDDRYTEGRVRIGQDSVETTSAQVIIQGGSVPLLTYGSATANLFRQGTRSDNQRWDYLVQGGALSIYHGDDDAMTQGRYIYLEGGYSGSSFDLLSIYNDGNISFGEYYNTRDDNEPSDSITRIYYPNETGSLRLASIDSLAAAINATGLISAADSLGRNGTAGQIVIETVTKAPFSTSSLFWDNANTRLRVGNGTIAGTNGIAAPTVYTVMNNNAISGLKVLNVSTGTAAESRISVNADDDSYIGLSVPSTTNVTAALFGINRAEGHFIFSAGSSRNFVVGNHNNNNLILGTNNAERFRITNGGHASFSLPTNQGVELNQANSGSDTYIDLRNTSSNNHTWRLYRAISGNFGLGYSSTYAYAGTSIPLVVEAGAASNMLRVDNDGVGINGITVPTEKLHVSGNIRVTDLTGTGTRIVTTSSTGVLGHTTSVAISPWINSGTVTYHNDSGATGDSISIGQTAAGSGRGRLNILSPSGGTGVLHRAIVMERSGWGSVWMGPVAWDGTNRGFHIGGQGFSVDEEEVFTINTRRRSAAFNRGVPTNNHILGIGGVSDSKPGLLLDRNTSGSANGSSFYINSEGDLIISNPSGNMSVKPDGGVLANYNPSAAFSAFGPSGAGVSNLVSLVKDGGFGASYISQWYGNSVSATERGIAIIDQGSGAYPFTAAYNNGHVGIYQPNPEYTLDIGGVGDMRVGGLAGTGTRMVTATSAGVLGTATIPSGADGNGFKDGSGTIPASTTATALGTFTISDGSTSKLVIANGSSTTYLRSQSGASVHVGDDGDEWGLYNNGGSETRLRNVDRGTLTYFFIGDASGSGLQSNGSTSWVGSSTSISTTSASLGLSAFSTLSLSSGSDMSIDATGTMSLSGTQFQFTDNSQSLYVFESSGNMNIGNANTTSGTNEYITFTSTTMGLNVASTTILGLTSTYAQTGATIELHVGHGTKIGAANDELEVTGDAYKTVGGVEWNTTSDRRIKQDIEYIDGKKAIDLVKQLRPASYHYTDYWANKNGVEPGKRFYSYIAQDVEDLFPGSVYRSTQTLPGDQDPIRVIDGDIISAHERAALVQLIRDNEQQAAQIGVLTEQINKLYQLINKQ